MSKRFLSFIAVLLLLSFAGTTGCASLVHVAQITTPAPGQTAGAAVSESPVVQTMEPTVSFSTPVPSPTPLPTPEPTPTLEPTPTAEPTASASADPNGVATLEDDGSTTQAGATAAPSGSMPYRLEVDTTNQVVTAYALDAQGYYTVVARQMICSTGLNDSPTPAGVFTMNGTGGRWGYFENFDCYAQYWTRIQGSILFHSVLYDAANESTLRTGSVNKLGKKASHGCVRLAVFDAKWIFDNCKAGTEVEVLEKEKNAELTAALKETVKEVMPTPVPIPVISEPTVQSSLISPTEVVMSINEVATQFVLVLVTQADGSVETNPANIAYSFSNGNVCHIGNGGELIPIGAGSTVLSVVVPDSAVYTINITITK